MAFLGYPRHLSKFVNSFLSALTMPSTENPQRFHNVFPIATRPLSGEPCLASAARYVFSS